LPRSGKKAAPAARPKSMPVTFDDFANGFDVKYKFDDLKQPVSDYLGEAGATVRLKGVKSAVSLASDNLTRKVPNTNGQAFGNRYDFGASLSAAIQAANTTLGDHSDLTMKAPAKKPTPSEFISDVVDRLSPLTLTSNQSMSKAPVPPKVVSGITPSTDGMDSPRPAGVEKPVLASQSYNELLDKYCFVCTNDHHRTA